MDLDFDIIEKIAQRDLTREELLALPPEQRVEIDQLLETMPSDTVVETYDQKDLDEDTGLEALVLATLRRLNYGDIEIEVSAVGRQLQTQLNGQYDLPIGSFVPGQYRLSRNGRDIMLEALEIPGQGHVIINSWHPNKFSVSECMESLFDYIGEVVEQEAVQHQNTSDDKLASVRMSSVNIVDEPKLPHTLQMSQETAFPSGEQPAKIKQFPEMDFGKMMKHEGDDDKEACSYGQSMRDLIQPGKDSGSMTDLPQSYLNENTSEDVDLKLGAVEHPYSSGYGSLGTRFDDGLDPDKEYNIVKGADEVDLDDLEKESVALPQGPVADENKYSNPYERQDQAISRDPSLEGPLYGR